MLAGARAHDYGKFSAEELCAKIAADGWQTVQLAPQKCITGVNSIADITPAVIDTVGQALAQNQLSVGVYGCYVELAMVEEGARLASVEEFLAGLDCAKALGAHCIGTETTPKHKQPQATRAQALQSLRRSLEAIMPKAEALGVQVAIEPVFSHSMATPEFTRDILNDMRSPNLGVILDPVNLLAPDLVDKQADLWQRSFDCFGDKILAVHVKGVQCVNGEMVSCGLAASQLDMQPVFEVLRRLPNAATLPVLREELVPQYAAQDLAFVNQLMQG